MSNELQGIEEGIDIEIKNYLDGKTRPADLRDNIIQFLADKDVAIPNFGVTVEFDIIGNPPTPSQMGQIGKAYHKAGFISVVYLKDLLKEEK